MLLVLLTKRDGVWCLDTVHRPRVEFWISFQTRPWGHWDFLTYNRIVTVDVAREVYGVVVPPHHPVFSQRGSR